MNLDEYFGGGSIVGDGGYPLTGDDDEGMNGMNIVAEAAAAASNPFLFDQDVSGIPSSTGGDFEAAPAPAIEEPIFNPARVQYAVSRLVHMDIANEHVVLAFATNKVQMFVLNNPEVIEEVEVTRRSDDQILKAFIDPSGNHILITTRLEENYYLHWGSKKVRPLSKMRGHIIESVAWDMQNTSNIPTAAVTVAGQLGQVDTSGENSEGVAMLTAAQTTRNFLIGTRDGGIYEVCIETPPERRMMDLMSKQEYIFNLIYSLDKPVTGLRFERFPPTMEEPIKFFVMATTDSQVYEFVGGPTFQAMMAPYEKNPSFQELPPISDRVQGVSGDQLAFFYRPGGSAQSFGWLVAPGLYHGNLSYGSQQRGETLTRDCAFLSYSLPASETKPPIAVLMTEFHYLLLYEHTLQCVNNLSNASVFEFEISERAGKVRGFAQDPMLRTVWMYCDSCIYEIVITHEDRDVWQLYMQRKEWDTAKKFCKGDPHNENIVYVSQAANYFSEGMYKLAAKYYAMTREPFEEVALMFINKDKRDALKDYLLQKLAMVPNEAITQLTVIATWIVEIFLNELNVLTDRVHELETGPQDPDGSTAGKLEVAQERLEAEHSDFRSFLKECVGDDDAKGREKRRVNPLHPPTIFNLIMSHGRYDDLVYYSDLIGDYERVISYYFREHRYKEVLETLEKLPVPDVDDMDRFTDEKKKQQQQRLQQQKDLVYKLSPTLISVMPRETVQCWMKLKFLEPKDLFPALIHYEETFERNGNNGEDYAVQYLQYCVKDGNMDPAVHNYLLSLLAKKSCQPGSTMMNEKELNIFLNGEDAPICYDLKYALRLCTKLNKVDACVLIYSKMGLYEDAVDLALTTGEGSIALAECQANKPEDESLRHRLWLKIAKKVVEQTGNNVGEAMQFLKKCELLKIEDILPYFSEVSRIDDFKDAICDSLEEYNKHMMDLKKEMEEAKISAHVIRQDIHELRNRCGVVRAGQLCDHCHHLALTRNLYLFPCGHVFHIDCLLDFTGPLMTDERRSRVQAIIKELSDLKSALSRQGDPNSSVANRHRSNGLRVQLDNLIAAECPLCGDMMIRLIEAPFIQPKEQAISQWAI